MKKVFGLLTALATAFVLCVNSFAAEKGTLVVLGDSIASGYGLPGYTSGDNSSAKDSFANKLGAQFIGYSNFAVDGRTSAELLAAMDSADMTAKIKNADDVVISIGGNDYLVPLASAILTATTTDDELIDMLLNGGDKPSDADLKRLQEKLEPVIRDAVNSVDINKTFDNIDGILRKIKALNPDCEIVILTVYNPYEGNKDMPFFDENAKTALDKLNTKIYAAAGLNGAKVADIHTAFKGNAAKYTNIASMDVHPNKDGHALIYSKLSELISSGSTTTAAGGGKEEPEPSPPTGNTGMTVVVCAAIFCSIVAISTKKDR